MSLSKQSELFAIREARNNLIIHLFTLTTLRPCRPETISEAVRKAPPEHLELALTVLTEARFIVWPRRHSDHCEPTVNQSPEPIADGSHLRVFGNVVQQLNAGNHVD